MSRLHKTIDVEGPEGELISVTVHELTVRQIIDLLSSGDLGTGKSLDDARKFLSINMSKGTTLTLEQAQGMAPSELKKVYVAFKEANSVFFEVAREAGLLNLLSELKKAAAEDFSNLLVGSLRQVMERQPSTTVTASLSTQ
jgi:hypothetical protein